MSRRGLPSHLKMRHDVHFVEQLASRAGAPVGRLIPIDRLELGPHQPRIDMGDLSDLVASIKEKGVLEPLLVKPVAFGRYQIISGERRYRAAQQVGLGEVPCIELDVDDATAAEIALIENLQRKDLTPFEEADGLKRLAEQFGYTHEEIARRIGKSRTSVTETLTIASLPEEIREECRRADIQSKSLLLQVARQPDIAAMRRVIARIRAGGASRDVLRQERQTRRPSERKKPYVFRYRGEDFILEMRFRRARVPRERVVRGLKQALRSLEDPDAAS